MANVISERYAHALYELANEQQIVKIVHEQLQMVQKLCAEQPDFIKLLQAPTIEFDVKKAVLQQTFGESVHAYVLNFLMLLTEKERIGGFADMVLSYQEIYYADQGICQVRVTTAWEMTVEQQQSLQQKLEKMLHKQVILDQHVDETTMGGVRLDVDNRQIDGTIRTQLAEISRQIGALIA